MLLLRSDAELPHLAEYILIVPPFDDLAFRYAKDAGMRYCNGLTGQSEAHELALMRAANGHPHGDPISFGNHVLDGNVAVGEGTAHHAKRLLYAVQPWG